MPIEVIENEFRLLISQLTLNFDEFDELMKLAIQSEHGNGIRTDADDLEQQKHKAIAKC